MSFRVVGAEKLREVGVELRAAPRAMRSRLRRNIAVATDPITREAQSNWTGSYGHLGDDLANATRLRVVTAGRVVGVTVGVYGSRMPDGKQSLPPLVEGVRGWRKPLFGDREHWYAQSPHEELGPSVKRHLPNVEIAVVAAVDETAAALTYGRD